MMKDKLLILAVLLFNSLVFSQHHKSCKSKISKLEDLNIISYNKCLLEKSPTAKKDKKRITERIENQLFLNVSSNKKSNMRNMRYLARRKRKVKSFINATSITRSVKSTHVPSEILFALVDELPKFENCTDNNVKCFNSGLQKHFLTNFTYPKQAVKDKVEGRVFVRFVINKKGEIGDVQTFSPGNKKVLEDEVKRIVLTLPKFKAGRELGQDIDVVYSMPIDFKL